MIKSEFKAVSFLGASTVSAFSSGRSSSFPESSADSGEELSEVAVAAVGS